MPKNAKIQAKESIEDLTQFFSKVLKDSSKVRFRTQKPPELNLYEKKVSLVVESKAVLQQTNKEIIQALKSFLGRIRTQKSQVKQQKPLSPEEQWVLFEKDALQQYEELTGLLRSAGYHVPQTRNFKLLRSVFHAFNSICVVMCAEYWWTDNQLVLISGCSTVGSWILELLKMRSDAIKRIMFHVLGAVSRDGEQHTINSATWFMSAMFVLALAFPKMASCMGTLALGFGDPAAAFVGSKYGHIKLFGKKTLEGTLGFFAITFLANFMLAFFRYGFPADKSAIVSAVGALAGAVAELYCTLIDDNLFVPVVTAAAVTWISASVGLDLPDPQWTFPPL